MTPTNILKGLLEIFAFLLLMAFTFFVLYAVCPPEKYPNPAQTDFDFAITLAEANRKADTILDQIKFLNDYNKVLANHVK